MNYPGCVITLASAGEEVESFKKILLEINDSVVYTLPSDLSLIKKGHNLENVFYGSFKKPTGDQLISDSFKMQAENVIGGEPVLENENHVDKNLKCQSECIVTGEEDTRNNNTTEKQIKLTNGNVECQVEPNCEESSKAGSKNAITEELKESSPEAKDRNLPTSSTIVNTKSRLEIAVQQAATELSKVLCTSKRQALTFHSFEDLETMCSSWIPDGKKCENEPAQPEENLKFQDWWTSANTVLTAANLQLQELKESTLKKSDSSKDVKCEVLYSSSEDSIYQPKKGSQKTEKKKSSRRNVKSSSRHKIGSSSNPKDHGDKVPAASQDDASWLWDESSKLNYIWDKDLSCYHLYNPELNCYFKWEPGSNKYYKWDTVSQNFKLWDCESGSYYNSNARSHSVNEPEFPMGNSFAPQSRNMLDQNYLGWFAMWNKQIRQMSTQVYQAEYFQNLFGKFHNS